jgi:hypothetical protein
MDEYTKNRLLSLMKTFHVGQEEAIRKGELLVEVFGPEASKDKSYNNPFDRELRAMIEWINREETGLICSDTKNGYWWAASLSDGLPAAEKNVNRALTQLENAKHLEDNLRQAFGGQLELIAVTKNNTA